MSSVGSSTAQLRWVPAIEVSVLVAGLQINSFVLFVYPGRGAIIWVAAAQLATAPCVQWNLGLAGGERVGRMMRAICGKHIIS